MNSYWMIPDKCLFFYVDLKFKVAVNAKHYVILNPMGILE